MGVTLKDVADFAGVSMKTVSNVINSHPHVRPEMKSRVQSAIDELGYVPNLAARRLATGRTGTIALAIPAIDVPYFAELARSVSADAERRGLRVLIEQTASGIEAERQVLGGRELGLVDGVIFQPTLLASTAISMLRKNLPLVLLGESAPPLGVDHVMIDNIAAARLATSHLIGLGRERIAFLGHERAYASNTVSRRLVGYQSALEEHDLPVDTGLLIRAHDFGAQAGEQAISEALDAGVSFDGLVCYDDLNAIGALRALRRAKLKVPQDVAVIGWDDIALAEYAAPTLTTIRPNKEALTRTAMEMLNERIMGFTGLGRHAIVDFDIAIRESAP